MPVVCKNAVWEGNGLLELLENIKHSKSRYLDPVNKPTKNKEIHIISTFFNINLKFKTRNVVSQPAMCWCLLKSDFNRSADPGNSLGVTRSWSEH